MQKSHEMAQSPDGVGLTGETDLQSQPIQKEPANCIDPAVTERLRLVVREAGGHGRISEKSGITSRTLSNLLAGQEPKLSQLLAIARTCDVRLEWLAIGVEPMRLGDQTPKAAPASATVPATAAAFLDMDDLAVAFDGARRAFALRGQSNPDALRLMQLTIVLYDSARAALAQDHPQEHPQQSASVAPKQP
jgi:DNA-binding phage protein